ncbi:hypothetical protein RJ641_031383 [Dillenia turbinata]|uniref:Uncharacterized protein n=1 Tax=Dillenia turbinata TaxID=194707 RepID=A0AAN8ZKW9_9MAGN
MLKRYAFNIPLLSNSAVLVGWCRGRWRRRRRKGGTIRLGSKRRGFSLGPRPVVRWGLLAGGIRMLKKIVMETTTNASILEAYNWSLPFLHGGNYGRNIYSFFRFLCNLAMLENGCECNFSLVLVFSLPPFLSKFSFKGDAYKIPEAA